MPRNYLVSYHPLCSTQHGRSALLAHAHLLPFSDGSCRREPDLEAKHPSITALCRGGLFAPRLAPEDRVFYVTVKGSYFGRPKGWALIAALEVIQKLPSHETAAAWYRNHDEPIPSNCMVPGNSPLPVAQTTGLPGEGARMQQAWNQNAPPPATLAEWDAHYRARARKHPEFVITRPIVACGLRTPRILVKDQFKKLFDVQRVPGTQHYKLLSDREFDGLVAELGRR
jgi:hypothetical protein